MLRKTLIQSGFILCLLISACASFGKEAPSGERVAEIATATSKKCGNGICEGPETADSCPTDCQSSQAQASATPPAPHLEGEDSPPLYFFCAVHVQGSKEFLPYTDPGQTEIDPVAAANMLGAPPVPSTSPKPESTYYQQNMDKICIYDIISAYLEENS